MHSEEVLSWCCVRCSFHIGLIKNARSTQQSILGQILASTHLLITLIRSKSEVDMIEEQK